MDEIFEKYIGSNPTEEDDPETIDTDSILINLDSNLNNTSIETQKESIKDEKS